MAWLNAYAYTATYPTCAELTRSPTYASLAYMTCAVILESACQTVVPARVPADTCPHVATATAAENGHTLIHATKNNDTHD